MPTLSRQYNKLCDLPDFEDPALRARLREMIAPGRPPQEELHRKFWEYAQLGLYLEEVGALTETTDVLSVAAGHEEPLYWLANRCRKVVATDIYGAGGFAVAGREADASMLDDPGHWAPYPYREDHLEVREMNALDLTFEDASFDDDSTPSSIEHFGPPANIRTAAREMARVLRPGGHLVIVTELFLEYDILDSAWLQTAIKHLTRGRRCTGATFRERLTDAFRPKELERDVIAPTGLSLDQPLDTTLDPSTLVNTTSFIGDDLVPATGETFPHIVLKGHGSPWTSAFLTLTKPASA